MKNNVDKSLDIHYHIQRSDSPIWSFAIHDGHQITEELNSLLFIDDQTRLREEDPYTGIIAELPVNQFIVSTSRFQVDINRPLKDCVYQKPEQAWGLQVWKDFLDENVLEQLYNSYQEIHKIINEQIKNTIQQYGYFIIYDIHSYNAKRTGPEEIIDVEKNPQINLGTFYNHSKWNDLTQTFIDAVRSQSFMDEPIDIRENVKFKGGYLAKSINERYGEYGCVLSIEFRKDFMDEWTGEVYPSYLQECKLIMMNTIPTLNDFLAK